MREGSAWPLRPGAAVTDKARQRLTKAHLFVSTVATVDSDTTDTYTSSSLEIPMRRPSPLAIPHAILGVLWARPKRPSGPRRMMPPWPWRRLKR